MNKNLPGKSTIKKKIAAAAKVLSLLMVVLMALVAVSQAVMPELNWGAHAVIIWMTAAASIAIYAICQEGEEVIDK